MEAGLNASLELQCRKTMEIRTKHVRAGFAAGLEASRLWKLEQNNMTKKGPFFGPQNVRKSRRAKMGLPSSIQALQGSLQVSQFFSSDDALRLGSYNLSRFSKTLQ